MRKTGWATEMSIRQNGRHLSWASIQNALSPDFGNQLSFIERVDAIAWMPQVGYRWFPEDWIRNWGLELQPPEVMGFRRRPAERHALQSQRQLHVREEHQAQQRLQSLDGAVPRRRIREDAVVDVGQRQHEPEDPVLGRLQQRRPDPFHRQSVSRAPARLRRHGDAPAVLAPAVGAEAGRQQVHRSRRPRAGVQREDPALHDDLSVHGSAARPQHHGAQRGARVEPHAVRKHPGHLPRELRHGLLPRLRRPATRQAPPSTRRSSPIPAYQRTNRAVFTKIQYLFRSGGAT